MTSSFNAKFNTRRRGGALTAKIRSLQRRFPGQIEGSVKMMNRIELALKVAPKVLAAEPALARIFVYKKGFPDESLLEKAVRDHFLLKNNGDKLAASKQIKFEEKNLIHRFEKEFGSEKVLRARFRKLGEKKGLSGDPLRGFVENSWQHSICGVQFLETIFSSAEGRVNGRIPD
jgi:hypothetical protein